MTMIRWSDLEWEETGPGVKRKVRHAGSHTLVLLSLEIQATPVPHSHPHDQISSILEGQALFTVGDETYNVGPGDVVHITSEVEHTVKVLGVDPVLIQDLFLPRREDMPASARKANVE